MTVPWAWSLLAIMYLIIQIRILKHQEFRLTLISEEYYHLRDTIHIHIFPLKENMAHDF